MAWHDRARYGKARQGRAWKRWASVEVHLKQIDHGAAGPGTARLVTAGWGTGWPGMEWWVSAEAHHDNRGLLIEWMPARG